VNNKLNLFQIFSSKLLYVLCMLFFTITLWNSISFMINSYGFEWIHFLGICLFLLLFIMIFILANRYLSKRSFLISLILLSLGIRLVWIFTVNTPIVSDFGMMYQSAISAANGDFSFSQGTYFSTWVYQLGFTMYQSIVINLFGEGPFPLKLLNVFYSVGITIITYKITAKLFNEVTGRVAGTLYAIFIPSIAMTSVLTNQHLATFLFYLAFYLLITDDNSKKYIWLYVGILLSLGDIIRPLGSLILLAIGIYLFITKFLGVDRKQKWITVKRFIGLIAVFFIVHTSISQLLISTDVTQYSLSNRDTMWKFVLGFNHDTKGQYSNEDASYVGQFAIGDERKAAEMELIKERLSNPNNLWELFKNKLDIMWAANDASLQWSMGHFYETNIVNSFNILERLMSICLLLFGIISTIKLAKDNFYGNTNHLLFILLILGYVSIHLLIEIQSRYRYFIIPSFIIIQSFGIYTFYMVIKRSLSSLKIKFKKVPPQS
jgi:4-amino-4-deoxy-L-arabinose transferase-like glycosyltransferase